MSKKVNFVMDEELLKSAIERQAGSVLKAIEEGIQNVFDAKATRMEIILNRRGFIIRDNGCGMTLKDIDEYFRVFGRSAKKGNSDQRGEFGMGRGQIFVQGLTKIRTKKYQMRTNYKRSISYKLRKGLSNMQGLEVMCMFYKPFDKKWDYRYDSTMTGLKKYFLPENIEVSINGQPFKIDMEILEEYSNEEFTVFKTPTFQNRIFSQNLYVKHFDTTTDINIHCNKKMELNFARNAFIDDAESTKRLYNLIAEIEQKELLKKKSYDATTGKNILEFIDDGRLNEKDFHSKRIIELADGTMISIKEIRNKKVIFGGKNNTSDRAIQAGHTVINDRIQNILESLKQQGKITMNLDHRTTPSDVVPSGFFKEASLLKLFRKYGKKPMLNFFHLLYINKKVFDTKRELLLGKSDIANAWTDGYDTIHFDWNMFSKHTNKTVVMMDLFTTLCHEYAHEDDDTNETHHDANFYKRYYDIMEEKGTIFAKYLNLTYRELRRIYDYEIYNVINIE